MNNDLEQLRTSISEVDRKIMESISERNSLAREVSERKISTGLAIRDKMVEEEVVERYRSLGEELGIGEKTSERVARTVIEEAVRVQSQIFEPNVTREILVVGGAGKMGSWLCNYFSSRGHEVLVYDITGDSSYERVGLEEGVERTEMVVLATPISKIDDVLESVLDIPSDAVVFDISSIKAPISKRLRGAARSGRKVCSIHPMFGPEVDSLFDRNVLICDCGSQEAVDEVTALFKGAGANLVRVDLEEHDEIMSLVLGLTHALNLSFLRALTESDFELGELNRFASTTFNKQIETTEDVANENPELYFDIQSLNPFAGQYLSMLERAMEDIEGCVIGGNKERFIRIMEEGRDYFGGY